MASDKQPLLRTLAPALRELERRLRAWLNAAHRYPLTTLQRATLEGLASDLERQAEALQLEQPLLVIMLMGGTGVGKSTLLNIIAGLEPATAGEIRLADDLLDGVGERLPDFHADGRHAMCSLVRREDQPAV